MGGDFNIVQCVNTDKSGGGPSTNNKAQEVLKQKINDFDLVDIWRLMHPKRRQYTWRRRSPIIKCRFDYFIMASHLVNIVKTADIHPGFRTDHSIITLIIIENNQKRGPGFWKLNTSLLSDLEYIEKIKKVKNSYDFYKAQQTNPCLIWELVKGDIRGEFIKFSSFKKKTRVNKLKEIESELKESYKIYDENSNAGELEKIERLEHEIRTIVKVENTGACIRAKAQWLTGEKCN